MRLLICAGGTGGGVYPALAVVEALALKDDTVLWVGGEGGMEANLIQRAGIPFDTIPAAGLHGVGIARLPGNLLRLLRGWFKARRILVRFNPDALLFTGGYVAVPMALAATGKPKLLFVPDIEPGLALKALARIANWIALTVTETQAYLPKSKGTTVTGYPLRKSLGATEPSTARRHFGLQDDLPVVLVMGGSQGAHTINQAIFGCLAEMLPACQIIHITGKADKDEADRLRQALPGELATRYLPFGYLHEEMGLALSSAAMVVSRAGASTLGEYPAFGLPAVLIPYPYVWRYQTVNAEYLAQRGAAVLLPDGEMQDRLVSTVLGLLADADRLASMSVAMRALAKPDASLRIAELARKLATGETMKVEGQA